MNLLQWTVIYLIISHYNILTCDNRYFKACPRNGSASLDSSFSFNCIVKVRIKKCVWIKPNSLNVYPSHNTKKYFLIPNQSCSMTISRIEKSDYGRWTCNPELVKGGPAVAGVILLQKKEHKINTDTLYFTILGASGLVSIITSSFIIFYIKYKKRSVRVVNYLNKRAGC